MSTKNLDYIKKYFLSFDKKEQESIYASLTDEQKNLLIEIGQAFHSNKGVSILANNILVGHYLRELEDIQIEYFIGLSELLAEGKSNEVIEKLQSSENLLFNEILTEFGDNYSFEKDLFAGVSKIEREVVKADLLVFDGAEEILDEELQYAINQIERKELKNKLQQIEENGSELAENEIEEFDVQLYAEDSENELNSRYSISPEMKKRKKYNYFSIAASIILIIGFSTYFLMTKEEVRYAKPPEKKYYTLIDTATISGERRIRIPIFKNYDPFNKDSLNIVIYNILIKQEEYMVLLENELVRKMPQGDGKLSNRIMYTIDSLKNIENTYSLANKKLILNLRYIPKEIQLLSLNEVNNKQVILKIENEFYLLSQNIIPNPLTPIADSKLINTIQSAYLSEIDKQ